jgi:hypothetical protein
VSYVARSVLTAERETLTALMSAVSCLTEGAEAMSRYQYLAHITELATEIAQAKKTSVDEVFKQLASLPRDQVASAARKMMI